MARPGVKSYFLPVLQHQSSSSSPYQNSHELIVTWGTLCGVTGNLAYFNDESSLGIAQSSACIKRLQHEHTHLGRRKLSTLTHSFRRLRHSPLALSNLFGTLSEVPTRWRCCMRDLAAVEPRVLGSGVVWISRCFRRGSWHDRFRHGLGVRLRWRSGA